ncbi:SigmaW regulon antibacterial [compost metagenome]
MAVAQEQEMKARVVEMRARVVESESQVPLAMAEALRNGKIGVMDYMNLKNIEADTQMRNTLGKPGEGSNSNDQGDSKNGR